MANKKEKSRLGFISSLFGGLTGNAVKAIKSRGSRIDSIVNSAVKGKPKKKKKKNNSVLNSLQEK